MEIALRGKFRWGRVTKDVESFFVVLMETPPGEPTCFCHIHELLHVQQFLTQATEERFHEAVLPSGSGLWPAIKNLIHVLRRFQRPFGPETWYDDETTKTAQS